MFFSTAAGVRRQQFFFKKRVSEKTFFFPLQQFSKFKIILTMFYFGVIIIVSTKKGIACHEKFELKKCYCEVKKLGDIVEGCTQDQRDIESSIILTFDTKEEALENLSDYETEINELSGFYGITEFYVEENDYNEDGESDKIVEYINDTVKRIAEEKRGEE